MSRYLAAFRARDEKIGFSGSPVPNKSEKAKNRAPATEARPPDTAEGGYSPFSPYSGPVTRKNAFLRGGDSEAADAADPVDERPPEPPALPPPGTPQRAAVEAKQAEMAAGLLAASRIRPSPRAAPVGHSTDEAVEALALVLAARPAQTVTDPEKAMIYFHGDARRRLSLLNDDLARGVVVGAERYRRVKP